MRTFFLGLLFFSIVSACAAQTAVPGAASLSVYLPLLKGKPVAVFANQTSVVGHSHLVDTLLKYGVQIKKIFSPEHGFRGSADAGETVTNLTDARTGIPIISLYGEKTKPSAADLEGIEVMVFDIQDVGVRFYTYVSSMQRYLEAAIDNGKTMLLLDRPNPNGFYVDGPVLDTAYRSFVGLQPVPVVYGMTIGEYARMLIGEHWLNRSVSLNEVTILSSANKATTIRPGFHLLIVPNTRYNHNTRYQLPVKPSPNLPNMRSVYLYPSLCFFEGTQISLGRGTNKPFQQFGHPSFPKSLYHFTPVPTPGAKNPPLLNQVCYGYDLSSPDTKKEPGSHLELKWLVMAYTLYLDKSHFFLPSRFINKLAGSDELVKQLERGVPIPAIRKSWEPGLTAFKKIRKKYLLYPDFE